MMGFQRIIYKQDDLNVFVIRNPVVHFKQNTYMT